MQQYHFVENRESTQRFEGKIPLWCFAVFDFWPIPQHCRVPMLHNLCTDGIIIFFTVTLAIVNENVLYSYYYVCRAVPHGLNLLELELIRPHSFVVDSFFFVLKWCVLWAGELSALAPQHKINLKHCVCWNSSEPATTLGSLTLVFELVKPHCVLAAWALWRLVRLAICSLLNDKHFRVSSPFLLNKRDDPQHWYPNSFYIITSLFPFLKVNVN